MVRSLHLLILVSLLFAFLLAVRTEAATTSVAVLRIDGTINPVVAGYVKRGIERAEQSKAIACVIEMDTPGGLDTAMRDIVQSILNARVPVIVYVSPSGARAASAGTFITLAAHVAAMAPNTVIGAATPVDLGGGQISEDLRQKIINDAAAYIRTLAESRGRNADWAEKAVREGVSATEQEALQLKVIDVVAANLDSLLSQLDGRQVTLLDGTQVTLLTKGATVSTIKMSTIEDFLHTISDPNIAYILLSLALLGITAEIFSPGLIFPGIIGAICAILAFYSLGQLPVNWAGVLLIILAFGLFIAELFTPGIGLLAAGGIVSLILGALILFTGGSPVFRISPWLIAVTTIGIAALFIFVISRVVQAHRRQATTGKEELIGKTATARTVLGPEGLVFYKGELWTAISDKGRVEPGEEVLITKVDGLKLHVTKKE